MDVLHLISAWPNAGITSSLSIIVKGLLLQGAELRGTSLVEASNDAPEIILMPSLSLGYSREMLSHSSDELVIPLYRDATREHFLLDITLPIQKDADVWILAGLAIFLADV